MELGLEPVKPCMKHCELILEWRNDPLTRAMSFNQAEKEMVKFEKEFMTNYCAPDNIHYFGVVNNKRVGYISLIPYDKTKNPPQYSINIMIAPSERGKAYGTKLLDLVCNAHTPALELFALVKKENIASGKMFLKGGFLRREEGQTWIFTK